MNPSIFKAYDIRGIYPQDLDEKTAFLIGQSFASLTKAKKAAVCFDARVSSPALAESLIKGLTSQGADVFNLGALPTECLYFGIGKYGYDGGVMITASHNPKEYNGFKMLRNINGLNSIVRGTDILETAEKGEFKESVKGKVKEVSVLSDYLKHVLSFAKDIKPLKVVLDLGNGITGKALLPLLENLPIQPILINAEPDGTFPNRPPNPLVEGASKQAAQKAKEEKADMAFLFDGDGDRIFLMDEKGNMLRADIVLLILAKEMLKDNPGRAIIYNAICSKAVPKLVSEWGGRPVRTAVGYVNVAKGIIDSNGIMGGELSGHYCFKDNYNSDSGLIALVSLLSAISASDKKVSQIAEEFSLFAKGNEINFKTEKKEEIIQHLKEKYKDGKQDYLDGATIEYKDWWFNIRPSNTEPLLRLTIESDTEEMLREKTEELKEEITKMG